MQQNLISQKQNPGFALAVTAAFGCSSFLPSGLEHKQGSLLWPQAQLEVTEEEKCRFTPF